MMSLEQKQNAEGSESISLSKPDLHEVRMEFHDRIHHILRYGDMDLERFGYRDDREETSYDGSAEWIADHTAVTPGGSVVAGILHDYASTDTRHMIDSNVIPTIIHNAQRAIAAGKRVVFLAEGERHGSRGSEQEVIANALDEKLGNILHETWDDAQVDIFSYGQNGEHTAIDPSLPVAQKLGALFGGVSIVEAALYASMRGQGESLSLSPEARNNLLAMNIDPDDTDALYRAAHESDGVLANIVSAWNRLRQENMLRKIRAIEQVGNIAIVTPGASHAFSCKNVLERLHDLSETH